jgi:DNA polymerase III subunit gamma/tau
MTENPNDASLKASMETEDELDFQTLYRRFRPQKFSDLKGQDHVAVALRNAVKFNRVAHAYLFSGPRGTGKTSSARILAKALNCISPSDGEPCCVCPSCLDIKKGISLDVYELDAASNNGVDSMRELVARAALGTPGRWKVYIIDEVHMLSNAASNALLKTLEEPPNHVIFVLATTDPQKILPTIRSRTQHLEFHLISNRNLISLLAEVNESANLGLKANELEVVLRKAKGSARDALSALDLVAVAGEVLDDEPEIELLIQTFLDQDSKQALTVLEQLFEYGHDAQEIAQEIVEFLREGFLTSINPEKKPDVFKESDSAKEFVDVIGLPLTVRAIELLGKTLTEMKDALDPRITLEIAILRLTNPILDESYSALSDRIRRLENKVSELTGFNAQTVPYNPVGFKPVETVHLNTKSDKSTPEKSTLDKSRKDLESVKEESNASVSVPPRNFRTIGALMNEGNLKNERTESNEIADVEPYSDKSKFNAVSDIETLNNNAKSNPETIINEPSKKAENPPQTNQSEFTEITPGANLNSEKDAELLSLWENKILKSLPKRTQSMLEGSTIKDIQIDRVTIVVSTKATLKTLDMTKEVLKREIGKELNRSVEIHFVKSSEPNVSTLSDESTEKALPIEEVQNKILELFPGATLDSKE